MKTMAKFQVGKSGITANIIQALDFIFKNHKQVRVSFLKASGRNKDSMQEMAIDLINKLSELNKNRYDYKIIGFTVILIKINKNFKEKLK